MRTPKKQDKKSSVKKKTTGINKLNASSADEKVQNSFTDDEDEDEYNVPLDELDNFENFTEYDDEDDY